MEPRRSNRIQGIPAPEYSSTPFPSRQPPTSRRLNLSDVQEHNESLIDFDDSPGPGGDADNIPPAAAENGSNNNTPQAAVPHEGSQNERMFDLMQVMYQTMQRQGEQIQTLQQNLADIQIGRTSRTFMSCQSQAPENSQQMPPNQQQNRSQPRQQPSLIDFDDIQGAQQSAHDQVPPQMNPNMTTIAVEHRNSFGDWNTPPMNPIPQQSTSLVGAWSMPKKKIYDLPPFAGEPELWPGFLVSFNHTTSTYGYTNLDNMQRLQKGLSGAAKDAVSGMLIYPDNVPDVMKELEFRFGRADILVKSQLNKVRQISNVADDDVPALINFSTKVKNLTALFSAAKLDNHLSNPALLEALMSKLPISLRRDWAKKLDTLQSYPTVIDFNTWLDKTARLNSMVNTSTMMNTTAPRNKPRPFMGAVIDQRSEPQNLNQCHLCQLSHPLSECQTFKTMTVTQRIEHLKKSGTCFICLKQGHIARNCSQKSKCQVPECGRFHHTLLHEFVQQSQQQPNLNVMTIQCKNEPITLFKILPVRLYGDNTFIDTHALLDDGAYTTIIDQDIVHKLKLTGTPDTLTLRWFDERETQEESMVVNCEIEGITSGAKRLQLNGVRAVKNLKLPIQSILLNELEKHHPILKGLPVSSFGNVQPKLLIGLNNAHVTKTLKTVQSPDGGLLAAKTPLGWVIYGPHYKTDMTNHSSVLLMCQSSVDKEQEETMNQLKQDVNDYLELDGFGVKPGLKLIESEDDKRARQLMKANTVPLNNRYQTGLLWKNDTLKLPNSFKMAQKRLENLIKKLNRDGIYERYEQEIQKLCSKGYARELTTEESKINMADPHLWHLPHFAVFSIHKPEKLRIVHDAAAKVKGICLNDALMTGPDLNKPMMGILLKFREGRYVVIGDIEEMFSQILIQPKDRVAQRFIWTSENKIKFYEMMVMTFGAACSPSLAQFVKNTNAERFRDQYPEAVNAIIDKFYVDDFVQSFQDEEEAIRVSKQVKEICAAGGFKLHKFSSNSQRILTEIEGKATERDRAKILMSDEKILGMRWNSESDTFFFSFRFQKVPEEIFNKQKRPTKRQLLSIVMSIFDPYGFLADHLIYSKLILQKTWTEPLNWDEPLTDALFSEFCNWLDRYEKVSQMEVPRCYSHNYFNGLKELHIFVDASQNAIAAVAYWVVRTGDKVEITFILGRTRCAPKKASSIPRLELQAAVIGSRMKGEILANHSIKPVRTRMWSDNTTVLKWIRSEARKYKPYVGHRITEVLTETEVEEWNWVPSELNPADDGTAKEVKQFNVTSTRRWIAGPKFLLSSIESHFEPDQDEQDSDDESELRTQPQLLLLSSPEPSLIKVNDFSSYTRLVRTTAYVMRAMKNFNNMKNKTKIISGPLLNREVRTAELFLCREAQERVFHEDRHLLRNGLLVPKQSELYTLSPYLDEDEVIRCRGRIDAATIVAFDTQRPIILPPKDDLTTIILVHYHEMNRHQLFESTIANVRQKFWIPTVRRQLRKVVNDCQDCKNQRAVAEPPEMGNLPAIRFGAYLPPFSNTGVDYWGPVEVTIARHIEKRWVALFVCMTTGAVHVEIAEKLTTDAFIICLRNFMNIRGKPRKIQSDQGRNFLGYKKEVRSVPEYFDMEKVQEKFGTPDYDIEWNMNCAGHPEAGGKWERLIQSMKRVLHKTLHETYPKESTLRNLLLEAMNIVNGRPLTHVPLNTAEDEILTPNHFLMGHSNSTTTPMKQTDEQMCLRKQWRIAMQLRNHFWNKWIAECLPMLVRRTKWFKKAAPLEVGQLVLVIDPNASRNSWRRGRIVETKMGKDGQTRTAMVQTDKGIIQRPAHRLAVLDVLSEPDKFTGGSVETKPAKT